MISGCGLQFISSVYGASCCILCQPHQAGIGTAWKRQAGLLPSVQAGGTVSPASGSALLYSGKLQALCLSRTSAACAQTESDSGMVLLPCVLSNLLLLCYRVRFRQSDIWEMYQGKCQKISARMPCNWLPDTAARCGDHHVAGHITHQGSNTHSLEHAHQTKAALV